MPFPMCKKLNREITYFPNTIDDVYEDGCPEGLLQGTY